MLDDFEKKCGGREKEKLRRNKAEPRRRIRSTLRMDLVATVTGRRESSSIFRHHGTIAMHENLLASSRAIENRVFFFTSPFFRPPFSLASDGVRWFVRSIIIRLFFTFHFFHADFSRSLMEHWRRVEWWIWRVNLGTYSLLSFLLKLGAGSPVCSVQQTMSFSVAHSWSFIELSSWIVG